MQCAKQFSTCLFSGLILCFSSSQCWYFRNFDTFRVFSFLFSIMSFQTYGIECAMRIDAFVGSKLKKLIDALDTDSLVERKNDLIFVRDKHVQILQAIQNMHIFLSYQSYIPSDKDFSKLWDKIIVYGDIVHDILTETEANNIASLLLLISQKTSKYFATRDTVKAHHAQKLVKNMLEKFPDCQACHQLLVFIETSVLCKKDTFLVIFKIHFLDFTQTKKFCLSLFG